MRVVLEDNGSLRDMLASAKEFREEAVRLHDRAAQQATTASRRTFTSRLSGRPSSTNKDRASTNGAFGSLIRWERQESRGKGTFVAFQVDELAGRAPYWLIQEIGTGESATILDTGETRSVKSQAGRLISRYLVWADAAATYEVPLGDQVRANLNIGKQQLYSVRDVKNAPFAPDLEPQRIRNEIEGKHYIQSGGRQANRELRTSLISLAQRTLSKPR